MEIGRRRAEAMQNEFAEMLRREVPPDDLLVNDFSDDMFDIGDYLSMLTPEDMDTSRLPAFFV